MSIRTRTHRWPALTAVAVTIAAGALLLLRLVDGAPSGAGRPRLLAQIESGGAMAQYLESVEQIRLIGWVNDGAPADDWPDIEAILDARCVTCHYTDPREFHLLALDRYEAAANAATVRPLLEEKVLGGSMGKYLETQDEQRAIVDWVRAGAPEAGWSHVRPILADHCVHCHNPETGVPGLVPLDIFRPAARVARAVAAGRRP